MIQNKIQDTYSISLIKPGGDTSRSGERGGLVVEADGGEGGLFLKEEKRLLNERGGARGITKLN